MQNGTAVTGVTEGPVNATTNGVHFTTGGDLVDRFAAGGVIPAAIAFAVVGAVILAVAVIRDGRLVDRVRRYLSRYRRRPDQPYRRHASPTGRTEILPTGRHAAEPVTLDDLVVEQQLAERERDRERRGVELAPFDEVHSVG